MTKLIELVTTTFLFLIFSTPTYAFPKNSLRPGGIAIISVLSSQAKIPSVSYNLQPVALIKGKQNWLAVLGISLNAKIGTHQLIIRNALGKKLIKKFSVKPHKYRTQHLTIPNKNKVNPNKKSMKRIEREFLLKNTLRKTYTVGTPHFNFIKPVSGRDSGRFGLRRILNKQKRNPHSGMDIAANEGKPVKATESGRVLFAGDLFFTGNVIYLDHGNGLLSLYAHLSKINVKKGQKIKQGDIIAKVGKTGRVTGAHLHWSVYLNGNAVDPALFLTQK